jgi:hypothetical protein
MEMFYVVLVALAAVGVYHIIEEIVWQIEKALHRDEINVIKEFIKQQRTDGE